MTGTTLCPRCGAPIPWDGVSKTVPCPYCRIVVTPSAGAAPRGPVPAMTSSSSGSGLGIGCALALGGVVLITVIGGMVAFFLLRSAAPTTVTIATPVVPTVAATIAPIAPVTAAIAPVRVFGEAGNGAGQLSDARSIALDLDENVYTADYSTLRVQKFDGTGKFQWIASIPKDAFAGNTSIFGMAVDTKGVLWVSRTGDLLKYACADGKPAGSVHGNYDTMWFRYVALDPVGNIATTHYARGDSDLLLLDPSGKLKKRVKNVEPSGMAMDGVGNVYLTMRGDDVIEVRDSSGTVKSRFGSKTDKHTRSADQIAVDGKGHIFVATGEGVNVFDQGGAFIKTIDTSMVHGAVRSFAITGKGHIFLLGNDQVTELEIGNIP